MQKQQTRSRQHQMRQLGREYETAPRPLYIREDCRAAAKLENRIALVIGGDSGIGRAVAVHFAREGAQIAIVYLDEHRFPASPKRRGIR